MMGSYRRAAFARDQGRRTRPERFRAAGRERLTDGESLGVNSELAFRHIERFLSRGRPRGLFAPDDRGTGKPSAESFDKLPPRQLTASESWRYSQFNCFCRSPPPDNRA